MALIYVEPKQTLAVDMPRFQESHGESKRFGYRYHAFTRHKTVPAYLKLKSPTEVKLVQSREKLQTLYITIAYSIHDTAVALAFSLCHPDDTYDRRLGKYMARSRWMDGEVVVYERDQYYGADRPLDQYISTYFGWPTYTHDPLIDANPPTVKDSLKRWSEEW